MNCQSINCQFRFLQAADFQEQLCQFKSHAIASSLAPNQDTLSDSAPLLEARSTFPSWRGIFPPTCANRDARYIAGLPEAPSNFVALLRLCGSQCGVAIQDLAHAACVACTDANAPNQWTIQHSSVPFHGSYDAAADVYHEWWKLPASFDAPLPRVTFVYESGPSGDFLLPLLDPACVLGQLACVANVVAIVLRGGAKSLPAGDASLTVHVAVVSGPRLDMVEGALERIQRGTRRMVLILQPAVNPSKVQAQQLLGGNVPFACLPVAPAAPFTVVTPRNATLRQVGLMLLESVQQK